MSIRQRLWRRHGTQAVLIVLGVAAAACAAVAKPSPASAAVPRPLAPFVDVTAESGASVAGELASWQTKTSDGQNVERLGGRSSSGDLVVFSWAPSPGRWSAENVSQITGRKIAGPMTAWHGGDGSEHLAGSSPEGNLLVFSHSTLAHDHRWKVVDVTARTGRRVAGPFTSWLTPNGPFTVEHVAGRDPAGNLLVFWWSRLRDWQVVDVSAKTGRRIGSPVASWQVRTNVLTEYLAGAAADGRVTVFSWAPGRDWQAQLLSERLSEGPTAWTTGSVEHLAGARSDGTLVVLWRNGGSAWNTVDVSRITGEKVQGRPAVYQLRDGAENVEILGSRSRTGHLVESWWKPSRDWQALSLTDITGQSIAALPTGWLATFGGRTVEHYAAVGSDGHVRVFYSFDQPRTLTDAVSAPYQSIKRMRYVTRKVLVVLMDQHYDNPIGRPSRADVEKTVFGSSMSVRGFFLENSGGAFTIGEVATLGWYEGDKPTSYYDTHDRMGAALRAADRDFDYGRYDANRNGTLEPTELAIVFAHPGRAGGLNRTGGRSIKDVTGGDLVLDGVKIKEGVELGIGNPPNLGVVAHELSHLLLGLPDMYFTFFTPTAPAQYSLMDNTYAPFHIDPFNKLKLGWAQPRLIFRGGRYTLPDIETRHRVLALVDPARGSREYFLVENRYAGTSYDAGIFDQGLGVWHVMEDPAVFDAAMPPPTVKASDWATLGSGNWGRKAAQMMRPVLTAPLDDAKALWDGRDYPLTSTDPNPLHSSLRWGDRSPSGFSLSSLGMPAADFPLTIGVARMP